MNEPTPTDIPVASSQNTGARYDQLIRTMAVEGSSEQLTRLAFLDDLTDLPKTRLVRQFVDELLAKGATCFGLAFIDLDNFKYVNDYYGHEIGDKLLQKLAARISQDMATCDMLARVGGDEFVLVISSEKGSLSDIEAQLAHLSARFREPFFIDGFEIFSSASIGASIYPLHGHSYDTLRANADSAMYRVKEGAKGTVRLYDRHLTDAATARMENEQRLRLAIRDRKIVCAFQPQIDFRSDTIIGSEVLLRWRDENGDLRPPGQLINLAVELGLMDQITLMICDQVLDQIDDVNEAFGPTTSISLNIAAKQATDLVFMRHLVETIASSRHTPRFILELTEEAFLSKDKFRTHVLPMATEAGLRVSIDDFGVGYSSLSALTEISAHELKIDRAFVTDIHAKPRNQIVLKMIQVLGAELGMHIIVEGVEKQEELDFLMEHTAISCAQGLYFAKPVELRRPQAVTTVSGGRHLSMNRGAVTNRGAAFQR